MALSTTNAFWSRTHFVARFLGLTALGVALVGLALALIHGQLRPTWSERLSAGENLEQNWDNLRENWNGVERVIESGTAASFTDKVAFALALGLLVTLVWLIIEAVVVFRVAAGRRSAFGGNVVAQLGLAIALLIGLNAYSYRHYLRFDVTRNQQFTLPGELQDNLRKLQGETTIVVYLPHQSFGQRSQSLDPEMRAYVSAAERKVVEKLKDMVDEFREFGKQFRVVVLDVEDWQNFKSKLDHETKGLPELREAINKTPENTIFFAGQGRVQRLSFNDLFLLDKEASVKANNSQGNLVLLDQGIEPLARKVLAINEKRPKVGVAVIHEWLTTEGREDLPFTMAGLKKALTARGFDVKDIVLKKWSRFGPPEPAVYTAEDSKLDRFEERLAIVDNNLKVLGQALEDRQRMRDQWKKASLDELTKKYGGELRVKRVTEQIRKDVVSDLEDDVDGVQESLAFYRKRRDEVLADKGKLNVDALAEQRRMADLQAKLTRTLTDCDLLIIPRLTLRNVVETEENIPAWLHRLDETQVDVLRDFVKEGKPVLFCLGPTTEGERGPPPGAGAGPDGVEQMLTKLGFKFVNQTVLFDTETEAFAGRGGGPFGSEANVEVPAVEFDWKAGAGRPGRQPSVSATEREPKPNPIRKSMHLIARSLGGESQGKSVLADLKLRHPQPIYFEPADGKKLAVDPEFIMTSAASWNEEKPFPSDKYVPEPPKTGPRKGSIEEKRRGPFPIGVAVSTPLPAEWYGDKDAKPATVRLAVIGHGGVFNGGELSPAREMLLLDTANWLLGRDQELVLKETEWSYPRVAMDPLHHAMWVVGAWLGLPGLFAYLGLIVVLVRRLR